MKKVKTFESIIIIIIMKKSIYCFIHNYYTTNNHV
jgi:hypothetical protein